MDRYPAWWAHAGSLPRPVAETRSTPYAGLSPACSESYYKTQHCDTETHADGSRWRRCKEVQQCFRVCPGRPPEEVSKSSVETLEPLVEGAEGRAGTSSPAAGPPGPGQQGQGQPVPADVGRLFDEFFQFASELERSMSNSGALNHMQEQQKAKDSDLSSGFLQRIFGKRTRPAGSKSTKGDMDLFVQYATGPSQEI